jgi:serpin B
MTLKAAGLLAVGLLVATPSVHSVGPDDTCARQPPMNTAGAVSAGIGIGLDLMRIQPEEENALLSPVVVETLLTALQEGATGSTRRELFQLLPSNISPKALGCLLEEWQKPGTTPNEPATGLKIALAGKLWARQGVELKPDYTKLLTQDLLWTQQVMDFTAADALDQLNTWVASQTGEAVSSLFTPKMVNGNTQLVLASTARLKGKWALPFDSSKTQLGTFHRANGEQTQAQMMELEAFLPYAERPQERIVLLPIQGQEQRWALMVVLPTKGTAYELAKNLHSSSWSQWLASAQPKYVKLTFPRLELRQRIDLVDELQKLGVKQLFTPQAELSEMADVPGLYVGAAITEAVMEVNELGLQASAAAGAAIRTLALREPPTAEEVVVDRPFLYAIVDRRTGALLFIGRCEYPGVR